MQAMDSYNSSDGLVSDHDIQGPRVGKRAIASFIAASVVDRLESKKKTKTLKDTGNAPSTTISRKYWWALFTQFADTTLHVNARSNKTPTGDDVARFIAQLPSHLQSRHRDGRLAWTMIKSAEISLERSLQFHYQDFQMTRHDALRIDAVIQDLLDTGKVTKDPVRERLWLTWQLVKHMTTAVFIDAIVDGTKCWDMTLAGCLGLVWQAALASRAGDFKRSRHYDGQEFVKWEDIKMVALGNREEPRLKMIVTLRFRKGFKRDPTKATQIELGQLSDSDSVIDPVKLLVAYALRVGAVEQNSWSELIDAVLRRPSRQFLWTNSSSPVFFAKTQNGRLNLDQPAPAGQQVTFLRHAARLVGMLDVPVSHDLRRGAASDVAQLTLSTATVDGVRRSLGHSVNAMSKGITDGYIGRNKKDMWAERVNQPSASVDPFGPQLAPEAYKKRKIRTRDIDQYCHTNRLDKTDRNARYKARQKLTQAQHDQWQSHQQDIMQNTLAAPVRRPLADITNVEASQHASTLLHGKGDGNNVAMDTVHRNVAGDDDSDATDDADMDLANIDPRLRTFSQMLGLERSMTEDASDADSVVTNESLVDNCVVMAKVAKATPKVLTSNTDAFVGFMSTIHEIAVTSESLPNNIETGNSRNHPSRFLFDCLTTGCTQTFFSALRRDQHMVNCWPFDEDEERNESLVHGNANDDSVVVDDMDDAQDQPLTKRGKQNKKPGIDDETPVAKTTAKRKRSKANISKASDDFPKPCPDSAICGVTKDFATPNYLINHRRSYHDANWPPNTPCNVPGCQLPRDHYFISRNKFRRHLSDYHYLKHEEALKYIGKIIPVKYSAPRGVSAAFLKTMCLFPDCKTKAEFANYSDYTAHLRHTHDLTTNQYQTYMPTKATVRLGGR